MPQLITVSLMSKRIFPRRKIFAAELARRRISIPPANHRRATRPRANLTAPERFAAQQTAAGGQWRAQWPESEIRISTTILAAIDPVS